MNCGQAFSYELYIWQLLPLSLAACMASKDKQKSADPFFRVI